MARGRNEDCWCESGRKYKHCHYSIDIASDEKKYSASQAIYAQNWKTTSEFHFKSGVYHWLAGQVAERKPKRILDIGCGSGHGLIALREVLGPDIEIVAIDENRACLRAAREALRQKQGIDAEVVTRMSVARSPAGFVHNAGPLALAAGAPCVLIESDVCNDPYLLPALRSSGAFDVVTIWLTGVHMLRQENVNVRARGIDGDGAHRLYVQNATYELADAVLKPGGVLQVGDRGMAPTSSLLRADILRAHGEQASVTSLKVQSLTHRLYDEPNSGRTPMVLTPGTAGLTPVVFEMAIQSIISEKP
jgi:SAM-dependent methyltransferase